jgi:hypothetical protein
MNKIGIFSPMDEEKQKKKSADRGKITLFRVTYAHQSKLIQIGDYKANIIITISTMIISAIIAITGYGAISDNIGNYGMKLIIPAVMIILTCLIALIFAIQATRPKLINNKGVENPGKKSSLLFFGVIASYSQQAYLEKMKEMLSSEDIIFEQMTIDFHNQGVILKRKYNLLVYSYQVLMFGFVLSVLTFLSLLAIGL